MTDVRTGEAKEEACPKSYWCKGLNALHEACSAGEMERVKELVEKGYKLDVRTNTEAKMTNFLLAARGGHFELVKWIASAQTPAHSTQSDWIKQQKDAVGTTSLMLASESGNLDLVLWLNEMGVSAFDRNQRGSTVAMWATHDRSVPILKWLVAQGLDLGLKNWKGMCAAGYAAFDGQLAALQYLYARDVSFQVVSESGYSVMLLAVESGNIEMVEWLISMGEGGSLFDRNTDGADCVFLAATCGQLEMVKYLETKHKFPLDTVHNKTMTPMVGAVKSGCVELVKYLMERGVALEGKTPKGETLYMLATIGGHFEMMKFLDSCRLPLDGLTKRLDSVETMAAMKGQIQILKWLIEVKHRSPKVRNQYGSGLAWWAAKNGHIDILEYLFTLGLSLQEIDVDGETPAMAAAAFDQLGTLKWLHRHGVPLHTRSFRSHSCLSMATDAGNLEIVQWLHTIGLDCLPKSHRDISILALSRQKSHDSITNWITNNFGTQL